MPRTRSARLAALFAALCVVAGTLVASPPGGPADAVAQSCSTGDVWCATLTAQSLLFSGHTGYLNLDAGSLSDRTFTYGGKSYTIEMLSYDATLGAVKIIFDTTGITDVNVREALAGRSLLLNGAELRFSEAYGHVVYEAVWSVSADVALVAGGTYYPRIITTTSPPNAVPVILDNELTTIVVDENTTGALHTFTATDADKDDTITWSLGDLTSEKRSEWFVIGASSGVLSVGPRGLDYEVSGSSFTFFVIASDGTDSARVRAFVSVRDVDDDDLVTPPPTNPTESDPVRPLGLYEEASTSSECPSRPAPFVDVPNSHWAAEYIDCLYGLGITTGKTPVTYAPDEMLSRAQMSAFVHRTWNAAGGSCRAGLTSAPFTDVDGAWFADDVDCLYGLGITTGKTPVTYAPDEMLSRAQMSAFMARTWNAADWSCPRGLTAAPFSDVDVGSWFAPYVDCTYALGITTGKTPDSYAPDEMMSRAQMAAFLTRLWTALVD